MAARGNAGCHRFDSYVPTPAEHPRRRDEFVQDFVRERGGIRYYVFLTLSLDEARQVLRIVTVGSYSRKA